MRYVPVTSLHNGIGNFEVGVFEVPAIIRKKHWAASGPAERISTALIYTVFQKVADRQAVAFLDLFGHDARYVSVNSNFRIEQVVDQALVGFQIPRDDA